MLHTPFLYYSFFYNESRAGGGVNPPTHPLRPAG